MKDRLVLRDAMKKDLEQQLKGWGIWLETVELTEVKICSNTLFENMQTKFKMD